MFMDTGVGAGPQRKRQFGILQAASEGTPEVKTAKVAHATRIAPFVIFIPPSCASSYDENKRRVKFRSNKAAI
jgi:hypothetical protein